MKENRQTWLDHTKMVEGGFVNSSHDPGGATNHGVTLATLSAWRRQPCTVEDVQALEWPEACSILSGRYWNMVQADKLPPGLDLAVADMAVHSGVRQAAKGLQRVLGVERIDGHVGPVTLDAARAAALPETLEAYREMRIGFLKSLPGWSRWGNGWTRRVASVHGAAMTLAREQASAKPVPIATEKRRISVEAATAVLGAAAAALPAAKEAFDATVTATVSLGELAVWLPAALGATVAVLTVLMLARRSTRLADQQ